MNYKNFYVFIFIVITLFLAAIVGFLFVEYQNDDEETADTEDVETTAFASSNDLLNSGILNVNWTKVNSNWPSENESTFGRIARGSQGTGDEHSTFAGDVIYDEDEGLFKMWYTGSTPDNNDERVFNRNIFYATSEDGLSWVKNDNSIPQPSDTTGTNGRIPVGASAVSGDSADVSNPEVIKEDDGTYRMWYVGRIGAEIDTWAVYSATSPDGITWTKVDNSVSEASDTTGTNGRIPLGTPGALDDRGILSTSVVKVNGTYHMWYTALNSGTAAEDYNPRIVTLYATSDDGLTWTKYNNRIDVDATINASTGIQAPGIVNVGGPGQGDDLQVRGSDVIYDGSFFYMIYEGRNTSGFGSDLYCAASVNGTQWSKSGDIAASQSAYDDTMPSKCRLFNGSLGKADELDIGSPTVVKAGNDYYLYYSGWHNLDGGDRNLQILLATSFDYREPTISDSETITNNDLPACDPADSNGDGKFTVVDLGSFALAYGKQCLDIYGPGSSGAIPAPYDTCGSVDFNTDRYVNITDFARFAAKYGQDSCR